MYIVEIWDAESFAERYMDGVELRSVEVAVNTKDELDMLTAILLESENPYTVSQVW